MDFDKEHDDIILLLPVVTDVTNLWNILSKSRQRLVWIKIWLQCRSTNETKTTRAMITENIFV